MTEMINQKFGEWTVLESLGNDYWKCICSCKTVSIVRGADLRFGTSTKCKRHPKNLKINQKIKTWIAIDYTPSTEFSEAFYTVVCTECNNKRTIKARNYNEKYSPKCECQSKRDKLDDLTGNKFGYLTVIKYLGNKTYACRCSCGNTINVRRQNLIHGDTRSCGCKSAELFRETVKEKYGETNISKIKNPREKWQINAVESREALLNVINSFTHKPSINDLCDKLGLNKTNMYLKLHEYNLTDLINVDYSQSTYEIEIQDFLKSLRIKFITHNKSIISPYELDIYIPSKRIAIEVNGTYWHSELLKDKHYHQRKTIDCIKHSIQLIHIFEYEWLENEERIKEYLKYKILEPDIHIGARETAVREIDPDICSEFTNKYHFKGNTNSSIRLGCYYNNELIGIMTFGQPRFSDDAEYELIRLCWKPGIAVAGGTKKMFKYFVEKYRPKSIVTYSDLSKFTGNCYFKLGFKTNKNQLTEPNYIWTDGNNVISRYQTQKKKLVEMGLGSNEQTEVDIMHNLGFYRIFDSGNLKFVWNIND